MLNPRSITEELLYCTIKLQTLSGGTGTGFLFRFQDGNTLIPVIVTNKHVVNDNPNEPVTFTLHCGDKSRTTPNGYYWDVTHRATWIFHPEYDLCCCLFYPLIQQYESESGRSLFYRTFDESMIKDNDWWLEEFGVVQDVLMVGYPIGLWDTANNFPLFRKGCTATHPGIDFQGKSLGVVDIACFPGSSGSPILILDDGSYTNKMGNFVAGNRRFALLGVLYAGPVMNATGQIVVEQIPTKQIATSNTPVMIYLGYYIKANILWELKRQLIDFYKPDTGWQVI